MKSVVFRLRTPLREEHFQERTAAPQISPLRSFGAPVEMTKGRAALPATVVAEQDPLFIALGGPKAHDSSGRDDKGEGGYAPEQHFGKEQSAVLGLAHRFRPTYAGASAGHPCRSVGTAEGLSGRPIRWLWDRAKKDAYSPLPWTSCLTTLLCPSTGPELPHVLIIQWV